MSAIAPRKPSATYGSCNASVLRTNLDSSRIKRLALCAAVGSIVLLGFESEGWASAPKEYPACAGKADDANVQAARGAFEAGKAAFNEADYARAIVYWEDAFRRDCSATLMLKNLARAYEASGQYAEAAVALETYLERAPEAEDRAELEEQLKSIKARVQQAAPAAPGPAPEPPKPVRTHAPTEPETTSYLDAHEPEAGAPTDDQPVNGAKLAAGLVAGAGLALGVASTLFWLDADADEDAATALCPSRRDCPDHVTDAGNDAIDRKQRWAIIGTGGGAVLVGGVIWYLVASQDETESTAAAPRLVPALAPGFAGFSWSNRF